MGLFKRKDSPYWWISFCYKGKQYRISTETTDKRFAEKIYAKVVSEIIEGKWFDREKSEYLTFDIMMEKFMKEHAPMVSQSMQERYKHALKKLMAYFKDIRIKDITPALINEYIQWRLSQGVKNATVNRELAMLSKAFNLAVKKWQWCKSNPLSSIGKLPENNTIVRWLTEEEQDKLLKSAEFYLHGQLKDIIIVAIYTGMRESEILSLTWKDIDFFKQTITVRKSKNKEQRTIPMHQRVAELLKIKTKNPFQSIYIFSTSKGTPIKRRTLIDAFQKAVKKAKIKDFRFHDLRHTFATRLVQQGVDLYTVAKLLGHKTISVTTKYAHHSVDSLRKAIEKIF